MIPPPSFQYLQIQIETFFPSILYIFIIKRMMLKVIVNDSLPPSFHISKFRFFWGFILYIFAIKMKMFNVMFNIPLTVKELLYQLLFVWLLKKFMY
jgi:hypothetical protein